MLPSYLETLTHAELVDKADKLNELLRECIICPNKCGIDRFKDNNGLCNSGIEIQVSSIGPHFGEEPPLVGIMGSGTIFLTNCNLSCVFCQNYDISHYGLGEKISVDDLAGAMISLQMRGCHNINFVTPTHFSPQIVEALIIAAERGLEVPLVYNCGGYESVETLKLLEGVFDIYMPDIKYSINENAEKYSGVDNYWETVKNAVTEMYRQVGDLKISHRGIAQRGLLLRHLVLPNELAGSKLVIDFIAEDISVNSYLNIMDQYRPAYQANHFEELNRPVTFKEYGEVVNYAKLQGLSRGLD